MQIRFGDHFTEVRDLLQIFDGADPACELQAPDHSPIPEGSGHFFRIQQAAPRDQLIQTRVDSAFMWNAGEYGMLLNDAAVAGPILIQEITGAVFFEAGWAEQKNPGLASL